MLRLELGLGLGLEIKGLSLVNNLRDSNTATIEGLGSRLGLGAIA